MSILVGSKLDQSKKRMGQVNFKVTDDRLAIIDRAASIRGVSRTEFVLGTCEAAALEILSERPLISLTEDGYEAFLTALDTPREPGEALRKLSDRTPHWER